MGGKDLLNPAYSSRRSVVSAKHILNSPTNSEGSSGTSPKKRQQSSKSPDLVGTGTAKSGDSSPMKGNEDKDKSPRRMSKSQGNAKDAADILRKEKRAAVQTKRDELIATQDAPQKRF